MVVLPCRVCWNPVPPERLDRWPWAVTCSPECSTRNESTARHRKARARDRAPMHSWMLRYVRRTRNRAARHFTCHCGAGQESHHKAWRAFRAQLETPLPQSLPQSSAVTGLAADAGPGRRRSQLPQIRPDALDAPDFVGIGSKPARQDGQRGRRSGGGSILGYLASWHDRGPGGRHDDGAQSR